MALSRNDALLLAGPLFEMAQRQSARESRWSLVHERVLPQTHESRLRTLTELLIRGNSKRARREMKMPRESQIDQIRGGLALALAQNLRSESKKIPFQPAASGRVMVMRSRTAQFSRINWIPWSHHATQRTIRSSILVTGTTLFENRDVVRRTRENSIRIIIIPVIVKNTKTVIIITGIHRSWTNTSVPAMTGT